MRTKVWVVLLACLFAAQPAPSAAVVQSAGLWQKALEVFRSNSDWSPGKVTIVSEVLDRKGSPGSVTRLFFDILVDEKGNARTELTQAFKDGKDISAEMKKNIALREAKDEKEANKRDRFTVSLSDNPFNPDKQQNVTVSPHAEKQFIFGRTCRRFDFSFKTAIVMKNKKQDMTWMGKAWLDENSGVPVKLEFTFEPLPKHIHNFWTIYRYDISAAGDWTLKEIRVEGQGGFLFIKKGFRSTTVFSDYRRRPQPGEAS